MCLISSSIFSLSFHLSILLEVDETEGGQGRGGHLLQKRKDGFSE